MKLSRIIYFVLAVGILSSFTLFYFYVKQKEFSENYKDFLISLHNLENSHENLNYLILQSSVFAYNNHDAIALKQKEIHKALSDLETSKLLKDSSYKKITLILHDLKLLIHKCDETIEQYLMLNAGVKNSLLFLTRHLDNAAIQIQTDNCSKTCQEVFLNANIKSDKS